MEHDAGYQALKEEIRSFITRCADAKPRDSERDALIDQACAYQAKHVQPYKNYLEHLKRSMQTPDPFRWSALPTDVFRYARIASHSADKDIRVFQTSGTTAEHSGKHPFADLSLYQQAAHHAAKAALFPDRERMRIVILAPSETEAPHSSLSYMLARFIDDFGTPNSIYVWKQNSIQMTLMKKALDESVNHEEPIALLGTSFAFVHVLDELQQKWQLPSASRIMQTGGFKGKSREVPRDELEKQLSTSFGIPSSHIIAEYGMTELSSQMYENKLVRALAQQSWKPGYFCAPPWVRVSIVDPDDLASVEEGQEGLIEIFDLANLDSVCGVLTSDLGIKDANGFYLLGRAPGSLLRGCSLVAEEFL
ncbi:MAG: acyl-protein synthetase [Myxococcales bacterium]|nr:MAG: acyl-protein synthetase [Myxococcales bacterium]